jgi:SAM-dependent methyltransferase
VSRLDDPALVAEEYADEARLRRRAQAYTGEDTLVDTRLPIVAAVAEVAPAHVLEVGCGWGELAAWIARETGAEVAATDLSPRMVELARERGVAAELADVQELPFADGTFDVAVAAWMLYHVPDLDRALAELARVAPVLVAATNGYDQLREMWELVGRDLGARKRLFMRDSGEELLRAHYGDVRMIDLPATIEMSADDMRHYIANSVADRHLAERVPDFEGTRAITASTAVFVASNRA